MLLKTEDFNVVRNRVNTRFFVLFIRAGNGEWGIGHLYWATCRERLVPSEAEVSQKESKYWALETRKMEDLLQALTFVTLFPYLPCFLLPTPCLKYPML